MVVSILRLPYELVVWVIQYLELGDVRNLSYTCKELRFVVQDLRLAKRLLKAHAPHSIEARDARASGDYAGNLRRLIKRRDAISSVSPYTAAVVAFCHEWMYENGVLCYARGRELRILDLRRSAKDEIVIELRKHAETLLPPEALGPHKYKLTLLYFASNIFSCIYSLLLTGDQKPQHYLLIFRPQDGTLIAMTAVHSISKAFVRNDSLFAYYGTLNSPDNQGTQLWSIRAYNLKSNKWEPNEIDIPKEIGTDIGSTVCFEVIDGFLYGLSNVQSLAIEQVDWISYYSCFRFSFDNNGHVIGTVLGPHRELWRRDHTEGPLDNRWTVLHLFKDEASGRLKWVETRKEWLGGCSTSRRTYYTTEIDFDALAAKDKLIDSDTAVKHQPGRARKRWPRSPHYVHVGDDNRTWPLMVPKCPVRTYHSTSETFIDLIDEVASFDTKDQQLRLRGGSRRPWTPGELTQQDSNGPMNSQYRNETGLLWPPAPDPSADFNPALDELYAVLNPPGYAGNTHGTWDDRSMVYSTGGSQGSLRALVFVSFDPAIRLAGTPPYPREFGVARLQGSAPSHAPRAAARVTATGAEAGKVTGTPCERDCIEQVDDAKGAKKEASWITFKPAWYRKIDRGYHFAR
ncbi:uncharacterized protein C8A04DRAFT_27990 [Dichotomopilus funicola]|uniref:F-box domain-containing protein n=1 Tax=Dichotomopilus funicola TaxID=1934379 RepID=A0AAN6V3T4_9PEZI|nr:hypothetical protein C8A04DRAFT_27990 [Dichotomopilus funicola]